MFYVESKGSRYATMAAQYPTLDAAIATASIPNDDAQMRLVWDCSKSPVGTLVATFDASGLRIVDE